MEQEKEAFGFYFSAHPVDRHAHLASMHGARAFTALGELPIPEDGTRTGATMAALVEDARWRTSANGRRYLMATLSDASGQFVATCFDDLVAKDLEEAARAGGCGLMTVELDRRPGEETPRVTVKRIQPFETLAATTRMAMTIAVADAAAMAPSARTAADARGARGEVRLRVATPGGAGESCCSAAISRSRASLRRGSRRCTVCRSGRVEDRGSCGSRAELRRIRGGMPAMLGGMQDFELRVMRLLDHAAREHGTRETRHRTGPTGARRGPTGPGSRATRASWRRRSNGSA